jgi:hypothetical protein
MLHHLKMAEPHQGEAPPPPGPVAQWAQNIRPKRLHAKERDKHDGNADDCSFN